MAKNSGKCTWSWPSGWCIGLRSKLRGFDAQLGHLHDACTSLPQKSSTAIKWLEIKKKKNSGKWCQRHSLTVEVEIAKQASENVQAY